MFRRPTNIARTVIFLLLFICPILFSIAFPSRLNLQFYAAEVTEDGEVLAQGEIIVKGWKFNYLMPSRSDYVRLTKAQFLSDVFTARYERILYTYKAPTSCEIIDGYMLLGSDYSSKRIRIDLPPGRKWVVVQISRKDTYLVGSVDADFDPNAILNAWKDLQS